ncbi:hypothetical protein FACS1894200_02750 [Spirochaetia bacterium]|nr:hypothetical protein FACS1894200_02750 [Spirochaetia bacterium]
MKKSFLTGAAAVLLLAVLSFFAACSGAFTDPGSGISSSGGYSGTDTGTNGTGGTGGTGTNGTGGGNSDLFAGTWGGDGTSSGAFLAGSSPVTGQHTLVAANGSFRVYVTAYTAGANYLEVGRGSYTVSGTSANVTLTQVLEWWHQLTPPYTIISSSWISVSDSFQVTLTGNSFSAVGITWTKT